MKEELEAYQGKMAWEIMQTYAEVCKAEGYFGLK